MGATQRPRHEQDLQRNRRTRNPFGIHHQASGSFGSARKNQRERSTSGTRTPVFVVSTFLLFLQCDRRRGTHSTLTPSWVPLVRKSRHYSSSPCLAALVWCLRLACGVLGLPGLTVDTCTFVSPGGFWSWPLRSFESLGRTGFLLICISFYRWVGLLHDFVKKRFGGLAPCLA